MPSHFSQRQDLSLLYKLNSLLIKRSLLKPYEHILLSISGGQDSVSLFFLLHRLSYNWNWQVSIIHCDHKWHSNSVGQAKHIARLALQMNINYYQAICTTNVNTEDRARKWRYEVIRRISIFHGYTVILTGHTATDRIESFFLHLTRGTGSNGFHSLSWKRRLNSLLTIFYFTKSNIFLHLKYICFQEYKKKILLTKANNTLNIIRPLLSITRTQNTRFIQKWNLYLWLDISNNSNKIKRNRIRHQLIPYLRQKFNLNIDSLLNNWIEIVHSESLYLENIIEYIMFAICEKQHHKYDTISIQFLLTLPIAIQRRILQRFLCMNIKQQISFEHIEQIRVSYGINKLSLKNSDTILIYLPGDNLVQINQYCVRIFIKNARQ